MFRARALWLVVIVVGGAAALGYLALRPGAPEIKRPAIPDIFSDGTAQAKTAATEFLETYLEADGRVVRRDQGNDTVSEGQAYAMLLAVAVEDRVRFESAWNWARQNLERPDGLLSWSWRDGEVADPQPAADADIDAARALLLASDRFDEPQWRNDAQRIALAVLTNMTVPGQAGRLLVAGPWANKSPFVVNPSYFSPRANSIFLTEFEDDRWQEVEDTSRYVLGELSGSERLPSDWATVDSEGKVKATGPPGSTESPRFGWDAMRIMLRMSEDCHDFGRQYAAAYWPFFEAQGSSVAAVYSTDRVALVDYQSPLSLVAAASAAKSAGRLNERDAFLDRAQENQKQHPTYYGGAWVGLGRVMTSTNLLGRC